MRAKAVHACVLRGESVYGGLHGSRAVNFAAIDQAPAMKEPRDAPSISSTDIV